MDSDECRERAADERSARLATVRPDGRPDLVPIVFAFSGDDLVFAVDHKPKSTHRLQRLTNIDHQPSVTVLFDRYDDNWELLWWVRMRGTAEEVANHQERSAALDALQAKYFQYDGQRPEGAVVRVQPTSWTGWSFTSMGQ